MTEYEIGKQYHLRPTGANWVGEDQNLAGVYTFHGDRFRSVEDPTHRWDVYPFAPGYEYDVSEIEEKNPVSPNHYQFPGGAEVIHISQWLTANAAQALQYIARSSRIDGKNKGDAKEDIAKAIKFLEFELDRLSASEGLDNG